VPEVGGLSITLNSSTSEDQDNGGSSNDEQGEEALEKLEGIQEAVEGIFDVMSSLRNLQLAGVLEGAGGILSGAGTAAGGGTGLTSLFGGIGASTVGAGLGIASLATIPSGRTPQGRVQRRGSFFQPFRSDKDGEKKVAEINAKTGEVIKVLDKREAKQKGILDKEGDLNELLEQERELFSEIREELPKVKGEVSTNKDELNRISDSLIRQGDIQEDIVQRLKQFRDSIPKSFGNPRTPEGGGVAPAGPQTDPSDVTQGPGVPTQDEIPNDPLAAIEQANNQTGTRPGGPIPVQVSSPVDLPSQFKNN